MKRNLINTFKKPEVKILKCQYNNLQYEFEIPVDSKDPLTFRNILDDFGNKYFDEEKNFKDFEIYRGRQINLNEKVIEHEMEKPYECD